MKRLENAEIIDNLIEDWSTTNIAFIREINFCGRIQQIDGRYTSLLKIVALYQSYEKHETRNGKYSGWPNIEDDFYEVSIEFKGIKELYLRGVGTDIQVSGFMIEDLDKNQMDNIRLYIYDYEEDIISFYAESGRVLSCEKTKFFNTKFYEDIK